MKLAFVVILFCFFVISVSQSYASECAVDCRSAVQVFEERVQVEPCNLFPLYIATLQKNPGCRRDLLVSAVRASKGDVRTMRWVIFVSRQKFPNELTLLAEAAMSELPDYGEVIREAFFVEESEMEIELAEATNPKISGPEGSLVLMPRSEPTMPVASVELAEIVPESVPELQSALVKLPEAAQLLDEDIHEVTFRMTAKVEGEVWPEQEVSKADFTYRESKKLRVTSKRLVDEQSMDNSLPIDTIDERMMLPMAIKINDDWKPSEDIRLDESRFTKSKSENRVAAVARKKELAPAGSVGLRQLPRLARSGSYLVTPAGGDYNSTIDRDGRNSMRPSLLIRPVSSSPTGVP